MVTLVHLSLTVLLFFLQNWMGAKAYSQGYIRFTLLDDKDEAHSLNFVIKVFTPIVFIIICAASFQYFDLARFNHNIIHVIEYYILLRISIIFLWERSSIVNWFMIAFYYGSLLLLSFIVYSKFIKVVSDLLPDFNQIKNEIWLLILVFVYQIGNGLKDTPNNEIETSRAILPELKNRKKRYINHNYRKLKFKYGSKIKEIIDNESLELIIFSILIYENFNRPHIVRSIERLLVRLFGFNLTQGIMQVRNKKVISDEESVLIGTKALFDRFQQLKNEGSNSFLLSATIKKQCPDRKFIRQILFIAKALVDSSEKQTQYQEIADEIIQEFELFDYELH